MLDYTSFQGNPKWIEIRKPAKCSACHTPIERGEYAFAYPRTKTVYCEHSCGWEAEIDFEHLAA